MVVVSFYLAFVMGVNTVRRACPGILCLCLIPVFASANAHRPRTTNIQNDELAQHRLTRSALIHEQLPPGFTSVQALLHVVVNTSGQVESATAWNVDRTDEKWARDQAEAAEQLQRFRPFKRRRHLVRAAFDDSVWIIPPVQWAPIHVPFPEISNWNTLRIKLTRTYCYGMCPAYTVEVHGDGQVLFDGQGNVPALGRFRSHISREAVAKLLASFRKADYFSLQDEYVSMITDSPTCLTSIQFDGLTKSVKDYVGFTAGMPEVVFQLERDIDQIARDKEWIR